MIFSVENDASEPEVIQEQEFSDLDIQERYDLQQWIVNEPQILGEELVIIDSEYSNFEETNDRLDILALDRSGSLVVVELKRDEADATTDLQAIKYASYCATLTAEEIQKDYRSANIDGRDDLTPEDVGERFAEHLDETVDESIPLSDEGWAEFSLDDTPRILIAAGDFGIQVTAPVMWLIEEYDVDISCVRIQAHEHEGKTVLTSQQIIPVSEAEDYMARRREKEQQQRQTSRRERAIKVLLREGIVDEGDTVHFIEDEVPAAADREWDPNSDFWQAEITGALGQSDNVEWQHNGQVYSFTGLTKALLEEVTGERPSTVNGNKFWVHPEEEKTISQLREDSGL